jgi:hypothetical protein
LIAIEATKEVRKALNDLKILAAELEAKAQDVRISISAIEGQFCKCAECRG